jgi:hypothetical protein
VLRDRCDMLYPGTDNDRRPQADIAPKSLSPGHSRQYPDGWHGLCYGFRGDAQRRAKLIETWLIDPAGMSQLR